MTTNVRNARAPTQWTEIFYSKPSLHHCYLLERLTDGQYTLPCDENRLQPADDVRPGFRVFRLEARPLDFVLADGPVGGRTVLVDDNYGSRYVLGGGSEGRFVVENGIRRVGDADARACVQAVLRSTDRYIHLAFRADLWARCYASFRRAIADVDDSAWTPAPGELMTRVERPKGATVDKTHLHDHHNHNGTLKAERRFELIIEATALTVAFNDGGDTWDSNNGDNYHIGLPGKYVIADGKATYNGPSDKDLELYPKGAVRAAAAKPSAMPKPTLPPVAPFVEAAI